MTVDTQSPGLDDTGKKIFDDIYNAADPVSYYTQLCAADYLMPEAARQVFSALLGPCRAARGRGRLRLVDVGCSYGVNAAIHRYGLSLGELQARYAAKAAEGVRRRALLEADRRFFAARAEAEPLDVIGLDVSTPAIAYAEAAGILTAGLDADFERRAPTEAEAEVLADADLVISTGAVGYVTETTFVHLIEASRRAPWIAAFTLRQFPFDAIAEALADFDYVVETLPGRLFPQRRFVDAAERDGALARLAEVGRAPTALEASGWYASEAWLARPKAEAEPAFPQLSPRLCTPAAIDRGAA